VYNNFIFFIMVMTNALKTGHLRIASGCSGPCQIVNPTLGLIRCDVYHLFPAAIQLSFTALQHCYDGFAILALIHLFFGRDRGSPPFSDGSNDGLLGWSLNIVGLIRITGGKENGAEIKAVSFRRESFTHCALLSGFNRY
jgi:hypothetical protein